MSIDFDTMSLKEMRDLRTKLDRAINSYEDRKRREALTAIEEAAREHGFKIGSIEALIRHRLETEHTIECIDSRRIATDHGAFVLHTYRDRLSHGLHFALQRGKADAASPTLVRVQMQNVLADGLHWRRDDFGPLTGDVLAAINEAGQGVLLMLSDSNAPDALLARIREEAVSPAHAPTAKAMAEPGRSEITSTSCWSIHSRTMLLPRSGLFW